MSDDKQLTDQIADQCRVVAHLAGVLADIHNDYARIFAEGGRGPEDIAGIVGKRTAYLMEVLGEALNGMDAATGGDEWTAPIFREAQRRWPAS